MYTLEVEVKNVKGGKAREFFGEFDVPIVDLVLRTKDFQAVLLNKYIALGKPLKIKIIEDD